jgi:hypothetical protein
MTGDGSGVSLFGVSVVNVTCEVGIDIVNGPAEDGPAVETETWSSVVAGAAY